MEFLAARFKFYYYYLFLKITSFTKIDFSSWQSVVLGIVQNVIAFIVRRLRGSRKTKKPQNEQPQKEPDGAVSPAVVNESIEKSEEIEEVTVTTTRKRTRSRSHSNPSQKKRVSFVE